MARASDASLRYPTFVVIGAMRSGTTSFHAFLGSHPEVFMSPIKGPALFVDPAEPIRYPSKYSSLAEKRGNRSDGELIAELTRGYADEAHIGEATDLYARYPIISSDVSGRMLRCNPEMKLIYLVRHPVDRILSQYRFERGKPLNPPPARLDEYLHRSRDAVSTSRYHLQLSRYLDAGFGRERIQVIVLEELLRDPHGQMKQVCRFLDIPFVEPALFPHLNATRPSACQDPKNGLSRSQLKKLDSLLRPDVHRLEDFVGRRIDIWSLG